MTYMVSLITNNALKKTGTKPRQDQTAQAQAEATKEAQRAGIAGAKARAGEDNYKGRKPSYDRATFDKVVSSLSDGASISFIAKETGLTRQTIYRIRDHRADAEKALALWGVS
jgi:putative DNA-invertase from lambdoid prophage Rac